MRNQKLLLTAAAILALATPSFAADMDDPIIVPAQDEYQPVEVGSGWYIRGDLSYAVGASMSGVNYRTFDGVDYGDHSFDSTDIDAGFGGGVGFGYRFNDYFRADFTADIFKSDFSGTTSSAGSCVDPTDLTTGCRSEDASSLYTMSYLANLYADLGTYSGFTPYIGAGAGVSRVKWDNLSNRTYCVDPTDDGVDDCGGGSFVGETIHPGRKDWRFTYALMAGVGYNLTDTVKLDAGYRFKHVNGGDMFGWDAATAGAGATGVQGKDKGYNLHEIKVGFRYELW